MRYSLDVVVGERGGVRLECIRDYIGFKLSLGIPVPFVADRGTPLPFLSPYN